MEEGEDFVLEVEKEMWEGDLNMMLQVEEEGVGNILQDMWHIH